MSNNAKDPKVVSGCDQFVFTVKKLGSETKPIEYTALFIVFILGSLFLLAGILAFIAFAIPALEHLQKKHLISGIATLVLGIVFMFLTMKIEKSEDYIKLEKENINKRKLLIQYLSLEFFKNKKLVDVAPLKKLDSKSLEEKISPIANYSSISKSDVNHVIDKLASELKVLETKKNVTIGVTTLIAAFKTVLALIENAMKAYWYYQINSIDGLGLEAKRETYMSFIDSCADTLASFVVCFVVIMGVVFLKNATTTISAGFGVQCRNVEYALAVLNEFKILLEEQTTEKEKTNNEVMEVIKVYEQSLYRSIEQQNEILNTVASTIADTHNIISEQMSLRNAIAKQNELLVQLLNTDMSSQKDEKGK